MQADGQMQHAMSEGTKSTVRAAKTGYKAGKTAYKAGKASLPFLKVIFTNPYVLAALGILLFICILVSGTSSAEMSGVFYLSTDTKGGIYKPAEKDEYAVTWDKNIVSQTQSELLSVIADAKEGDRDAKLSQIESDCNANGWDVDLTLGQLSEETVVSQNTSSTTTGKESSKTEVLKKYDLSDYKGKKLEKFECKDITIKWAKDSDQEKIATSKNLTIDRYGLAKYKGNYGEDYVISLPEKFGKSGDRFRITFENGTVCSCILLKTSDKDDGILSFYTDPDKLDEKTKKKNNVAELYSGQFDKITSIEKIKGSIQTTEVFLSSAVDTNILSAYSVLIDNSQLTKVERKLGNGKKITEYKNNNGTNVNIKTKANGEIDYKGDLEERLKNYKGSYYTLTYEKDGDGNTKVYEKEIIIGTKDVYDKEKGKKVTVNVTRILKYAIPVLQEKDINTMGKNIFGINMKEPYVNGDGTATNADAIKTMSQMTHNLFFGESYSYSNTQNLASSNIPKELQGKYAWPVPGCVIITSDFGPRNINVAGASKNHKGIDIGCSYSPVVAIEDGTITMAQWYGGYGNYIEMKTKDGCRVCYGHLSSINVSVGQKVQKNQQIAVSGNSGTSSGPHLHIEVHGPDGTELDPTLIIMKNRNDSAWIWMLDA